MRSSSYSRTRARGRLSNSDAATAELSGDEGRSATGPGMAVVGLGGKGGALLIAGSL